MADIDNAQQLADELGIDVEIVEAWADDLSSIAAKCLDGLDDDIRKKALYYLTAYFLNTNQGSVTSESLGDASWSYAERANGMSGNAYGRMALALAPCLGYLGVSNVMTVRLL